MKSYCAALLLAGVIQPVEQPQAPQGEPQVLAEDVLKPRPDAEIVADIKAEAKASVANVRKMLASRAEDGLSSHPTPPCVDGQCPVPLGGSPSADPVIDVDGGDNLPVSPEITPNVLPDVYIPRRQANNCPHCAPARQAVIARHTVLRRPLLRHDVGPVRRVIRGTVRIGTAPGRWIIRRTFGRRCR